MENSEFFGLKLEISFFPKKCIYHFVIACIEADFCDNIRVGKRLTRSTKCLRANTLTYLVRVNRLNVNSRLRVNNFTRITRRSRWLTRISFTRNWCTQRCNRRRKRNFARNWSVQRCNRRRKRWAPQEISAVIFVCLYNRSQIWQICQTLPDFCQHLAETSLVFGCTGTDLCE